MDLSAISQRLFHELNQVKPASVSQVAALVALAVSDNAMQKEVKQASAKLILESSYHSGSLFKLFTTSGSTPWQSSQVLSGRDQH